MSEEVDRQCRQHGFHRPDKDRPYQVEWEENSELHPRNWHWSRKICDSVVILFIQFFTSALSTAGTSLGLAAKREYGLTRTTAIAAFVLTYQLGRVTGSITLPPWTETFGRKRTYIISMLVYSIMCLIVGVVPNVAGAIVGRVISGAVSAVGGSVAAGSMQDLYGRQSRIWAVYAWTAAGTSGLAIGPIYGSYIVATIGWRWAFYIAAIIAFAASGACLSIHETRADRILQAKVAEIRLQTGFHDLCCDSVRKPTLKTLVTSTLIRPVYFFLTEPLVTTVVMLAATAWSLIFLFTEALTVIFGLDGFSDTQSSLFFIPILIGVFLSAPVRIRDWKLMRRHIRNGQEASPEDKLLGFTIGAPVLAVGLWWFAWTTPQAVHTRWIVPSLALVLVGFAINEFEYVLAGYLTDCYTTHASSAVGAISFFRSIFAGTLPLFAYFMFTGISTNAASSILASIATLFCLAPVLFIRFGATLRQRSQFASYNRGLEGSE